MKHFANEDEALAYVMPELIDTLRDDLENMQNAERDTTRNPTLKRCKTASRTLRLSRHGCGSTQPRT